MFTEAEVYDVRHEYYDPEIPVNVVRPGTGNGVTLEGGVVNVKAEWLS